MDIVFYRYGDLDSIEDEKEIEDNLYNSLDLNAQKKSRQIYDLSLMLDRVQDIVIWSSGTDKARKNVKYLKENINVAGEKSYNFLNEGNYEKFLRQIHNTSEEVVLIVDQEPTIGQWIEKLTGAEIKLRPMESAYITLDKEEGYAHLLGVWKENHSIEVAKFDKCSDESMDRWFAMLLLSNYQELINNRYRVIDDITNTSNIYKLRSENRRFINLIDILEPCLNQKYFRKIKERIEIINDQLTNVRMLDLLVISLEALGMGENQIYDEVVKIKYREEHILKKYFVSYDGRKLFNSILKNTLRSINNDDREEAFTCREFQEVLDEKLAELRTYVEENIGDLEDMDLDDLWEIKSINEKYIFTYELSLLTNSAVDDDFYRLAIKNDDDFRLLYNKMYKIKYLREDLWDDIKAKDDIDLYIDKEEAIIKDVLKKIKEN